MRIKTDLANKAVADELRRLFSDKEYTPTPEEEVKDTTRREKAKLEAQLRRDMEAYDAGAYSPAVYAELRTKKLARIKELDDEQLQMDIARKAKQDREQMFTTMQELLPEIDYWLVSKPKVARYHLSKVVQFIASPDKTIRGELY